MAYSDFTLNQLKQNFNLRVEEQTDLFSGIPECLPSELLQAILRENTPLALAIHTEKARSELIISPILVEVRRLLERQVSLFSGVDFTVAPEQGLNGVCDFLFSRSPEQLTLTAPIMVLVEAKNDNIKAGIPQCIAEMIAAQLYNDRENTGIATIHGVVTTGSIWRFLRLEHSTVIVDMAEYYLDRLDKILAILTGMLKA
jgi:hypothetical protein